uniref:Uncharacterized protein n=1 Tax=Arundo donax TaxID=35708 RepID=A0A0A9C450_ARUDO
MRPLNDPSMGWLQTWTNRAKNPPTVVATAKPQTMAPATAEGMTAATFQANAIVSSVVSGHTASLARSLSGDPGAARSYARRQPKRRRRRR